MALKDGLNYGFAWMNPTSFFAYPTSSYVTLITLIGSRQTL
jgi:hypothetical protein